MPYLLTFYLTFHERKSLTSFPKKEGRKTSKQDRNKASERTIFRAYNCPGYPLLSVKQCHYGFLHGRGTLKEANGRERRNKVSLSLCLGFRRMF